MIKDNKEVHEQTADEPEPSAPAEMQIDLGYADLGEHPDMAEDSHTLHLDSIQTLSLDQIVVDEEDVAAPDHFTESATLSQPTAASVEAMVTLSEMAPGDSPMDSPLESPPAPNIAAPKLNADAASPFVTIKPAQTPPQAPLKAPSAPEPVSAHTFNKPLPEKSDNPFLPQHILDKLSQGRKDLADDIVQSSAALDVSTAILRTQARAERMNKPTLNNNPFSTRDRTAKAKQQLVDDLVEEYLPLVAAELRRRLHKLLDE